MFVWIFNSKTADFSILSRFSLYLARYFWNLYNHSISANFVGENFRSQVWKNISRCPIDSLDITQQNRTRNCILFDKFKCYITVDFALFHSHPSSSRTGFNAQIDDLHPGVNILPKWVLTIAEYLLLMYHKL